MCNHDENKETTYLKYLDSPGYEIYLCECGALINLLSPHNSSDPIHPMTAEEIEEMIKIVSYNGIIGRLQEIARRKASIWDEDIERGCGLLVRKDSLAIEYQMLTKEYQGIMYQIIGPDWWRL